MSLTGKRLDLKGIKLDLKGTKYDGPWDIRFKTSFNCIVHGPSGTGKTTFVRNLLTLRELMFTTPPAKVILFYNMHQLIYEEMKNETLVDELINVSSNFPSLEEIVNMVHPYKDSGGSLLIFDDVLTQLNPDFERIFCNLSHHENASVIFMSQNLFYRSGIYRTLSLNAHYFVFMKNDRDKQQISTLARQICPGNSEYIVQAYEEATKKPYSYLVADFRPDTPPTIRLRSHLFPSECPTVVYLEK